MSVAGEFGEYPDVSVEVLVWMDSVESDVVCGTDDADGSYSVVSDDG